MLLGPVHAALTCGIMACAHAVYTAKKPYGQMYFRAVLGLWQQEISLEWRDVHKIYTSRCWCQAVLADVAMRCFGLSLSLG